MSHAAFDRLLSRYVSADGRVDYRNFRSEKDALQEYIRNLEKATILKSLNKDEELAYWINLYNAATVFLVLENYPVSSIMDINDGKPWDLKVAEVGGRSLSLNEIEHDIIRKKFEEPRIHFAVNCAAVSCPKLRNEAYIATKLDQQLTSQKESFLDNSSKNFFEGNPVKVSKIFDWYREDFGSLHRYLADYLPEFAGLPQIGFMEYNWDLND